MKRHTFDIVLLYENPDKAPSFGEMRAAIRKAIEEQLKVSDYHFSKVVSVEPGEGSSETIDGSELAEQLEAVGEDLEDWGIDTDGNDIEYCGNCDERVEECNCEESENDDETDLDDKEETKCMDCGTKHDGDCAEKTEE